ncbi:MFS general substrate transporter [Zopfia rhizophila CBS 207.26]|uniref:MFS general substrate transporter n=1 Tax=Zopfia rhizophila CBS 207.26 TaxID=1314779 RepID=A0A6A6DZV6_9PEZI|nr:MFS general substrate transporter [Zopfia rhizophila CBS 207.26]
MVFSSSSFLSDSDGESTIRAVDERTPLLVTATAEPVAEPIEEVPKINGNTERDGEDEDAPLPFIQIFFLCYTRLVEPIAFFSIFPYINKMIYDTGGIEKSDVGFYSGLIESLFSATQMCVMIAWGRAADRFGRKPVLVFSLCGVTVATALFGMSKTVWQMILFRCLAGVFAGTIVTVRAMITENSTKKTQARAFSYFAFAGNLGIFAGPFIGSPADKFESTLGRIRFFREYPYALPGFISASIGASAAILSALFIRETLYLHRSKKKSNETPMSTWELLNYPGVRQVILIYNHVLLLAFAFTAVLPVYLFTPIELGGTGFSPFYISVTMGIAGLSQALWLLLIFPSLQHRIGTGGVLRLCAAAWPFFFAALPICNVLLRHNLRIAFWILGPVNAVVGSGVAMAFTANQLAVNDIAPSQETLGTLNAMVLALSSGLRAFVPALSTSLWATGVRLQIFEGELFWVVVIGFALALSVMLKYIPEKAEGKPQRRVNGEV